jgi:uroporphyrinogen decarboxylase
MKKLLDLILEKKVEKIPPIWIMRQAGRYLPEYLEIRKNFSGFLDLCYNPEVASEITMQPINRFGFDAAIIFSDILVIPDALGVEVNFVKNEGPKLGKIGELKIENVLSHLQPVFENLKITRQKLGKEKTLIGFSGAPFTLACYMIEGGSSKNFDLTKQTAIKNEEYFAKIINVLIQAVSIYLIEQINSGADVVKIFDSWAGILSQNQFQKWVIEPTIKIIENVKKVHPNTPIIAFPKGAGTLYENYVKKVDCDVLAIDQNISDDFVVNVLQDKENKIIQGNFDNFLLCYGSKNQIEKRAMEILEKFNNKPFIFNLGHGIIKETPIKNVEFLLDLIRKR